MTVSGFEGEFLETDVPKEQRIKDKGPLGCGKCGAPVGEPMLVRIKQSEELVPQAYCPKCSDEHKQYLKDWCPITMSRERWHNVKAITRFMKPDPECPTTKILSSFLITMKSDTSEFTPPWEDPSHIAQDSVAPAPGESQEQVFQLVAAPTTVNEVIGPISKEVDHSARAHAHHGPSSLHYKELCPGWKNSGGTSAASEEGTMMHEAAETGDLSKLSEEQTTCVRMVMDYVQNLLPYGATIHRELRLAIPYCEFGTADIVAIAGRTAYVVDYKFGRNSVPDAEENPQGFAYAIGTFDRFDVDNVEVHFLLPRRDEASSHSFSRSIDYPKMLLRIATIVERCDADSKDLRPSPVACLYCGNKASCSALHSMALVLAPKYDVELALPGSIHGSQITDPTVMGRALMLAPIMEAWAEGVKKAALEMRLGGTEIPGYELAERAGSRKVTNTQAAYDTALAMGVPHDKIIACADISLPELEKELAEVTPRGKKKTAQVQLNDTLSDLDAITRGSTSTFLRKTRG